MTNPVLRFRWWLVGGAIAFGLLTGFSLGVLCEARAEAGPTPRGPVFDQRIHGGTVLQQAAADWLLVIRPDFDAVVTHVEFVPQRSLFVNAIDAPPQTKLRCRHDDHGRPLAEGRCVGEAIGHGKVRFAREYEPNDIQHLLFVIAHEYAHHVLYRQCGLCTLDESLADACALHPTHCGRAP